MAHKYFVTATGTDIGKTYITARLCKKFRAEGKKVCAIKPIISGYLDGYGSDTHILLEAQGLEVTQENIEKISPWRFKDPVSLDIAAIREKRSVDFDEVLKFCQQAGEGADYVFLEGAGGVMSPINNYETNLDLIDALGWEVILVTGNYLGTITHTLTALEVLRGHHKEDDRDIRVIMNEVNRTTLDKEIVDSMKRFGVNVIHADEVF
jgi:dethiobiotin synthetase